MYDDLHHTVRAPKPWARWLLLLVILSATLVIGYALGSMQTSSNETTDVTVSTNEATESSEAATANNLEDADSADAGNAAATVELSQTFKSPYGWQVKYPGDWDHSKMDASETCFFPLSNANADGMCIAVRGVTLEEFVAIYNTDRSTATVGDAISLAGIKATPVTVESSSAPTSNYLFIQGKQASYQVSYDPTRDIHNQILQTFTFTDLTLDPSGIE